MNAPGLAHFFRLIFLVCLMVFCLHPAAARGAASGTSLVEHRLGGETILSTSPAKLATAVRDSVADSPAKAGPIVQAALRGGRADADAIAPQVTTAAIEALGTNPAPVPVSEIVYASVKATPAVVLDIVKAAVKAAPGSAKTIVRAAIKAIPNPTDKIQPLVDRPADSGFSKDAKDMPEPQAEDPLPIGEAIANAAHQADPSLSMDDLMNTVRQASLEKPGVQTYPGYYYPPVVSTAPSATPGSSIPPAAPTPPVVSK